MVWALPCCHPPVRAALLQYVRQQCAQLGNIKLPTNPRGDASSTFSLLDQANLGSSPAYKYLALVSLSALEHGGYLAPLGGLGSGDGLRTVNLPSTKSGTYISATQVRRRNDGWVEEGCHAMRRVKATAVPVGTDLLLPWPCVAGGAGALQAGTGSVPACSILRVFVHVNMLANSSTKPEQLACCRRSLCRLRCTQHPSCNIRLQDCTGTIAQDYTAQVDAVVSAVVSAAPCMAPALCKHERWGAGSCQHVVLAAAGRVAMPSEQLLCAAMGPPISQPVVGVVLRATRRWTWLPSVSRVTLAVTGGVQRTQWARPNSPS